jgi:hypothetical protein
MVLSELDCSQTRSVWLRFREYYIQMSNGKDISIVKVYHLMCGLYMCMTYFTGRTSIWGWQITITGKSIHSAGDYTCYQVNKKYDKYPPLMVRCYICCYVQRRNSKFIMRNQSILLYYCFLLTFSIPLQIRHVGS